MILITRPFKEAKKLKMLLSTHGYESHINALTKIKKKNSKIVFTKGNVVLLTSSRATKIITDDKSLSKQTPFIVVGSTSRDKLKEFGFNNILHCAQSAQKLLKNLKPQLKKIFKERKVKGLDHYTGSINSQTFIKKVKKEIDIPVSQKIIYQTKFIKSLSLETSRLIASNKIKVCLLFSQQNAQHFVNLIKKANLKEQGKNIKYLTLSSNITKILKKNGYTRVSSSNFPTLASMLDKLLKMRML